MFASLLLVSSLLHVADAADDQLQPQVAVSAQGSEKLTERVSLRGSGHAFWIPQKADTDDAMIAMIYVGPKFSLLSGRYTIAPQIGAVENFFGEGDVMPIVSVWNWVDIGHIHGFVEAEIYPDFDDGNITYFGFYGVDYDCVPLVWVGAHVEQVGTNINAGPHVGIPLGNVWIQANYHRGLDDTNVLRLNVNLTL